MRVSGTVHIVLAVRLSPQTSAWTFAKGSLLARGYHGTMSATIGVPIGELLEKKSLFASQGHPGGVRPVSVRRASELAWGIFGWSLVRGTLDDGEGYSPALGALPPPPGDPERWSCAFEQHFCPAQLEIADLIVEGPDRWDGAAVDRPDVLVETAFKCTTEQPVALAAEFDARPFELPYDRRTGRYSYCPSKEDGSPGEERGWIELDGIHVTACARSAAAAADLAACIDPLVSCGLELKTALWLRPPGEPEVTEAEIVVVRAGRRRG